MPTLEADLLVKKMTKPQKRAMFEALVREFYPKVTLTDVEREAEIRELENRHATRDQCMTVEEVIAASKEPGSI